MSTKENLGYKVKIDVPNVIELISETFDDVLNYMLPGMLVFGGVLRDITAGFELHHDLDIAASESEGEEFIRHLGMSSKWMEESVIAQYKKRAKVMENNILSIVSPHSMENGMLDLVDRNFFGNIRSKPSDYDNAHIRNVKTFISSSGRKLQIIISKSDLFAFREAPPIDIVKTVDFICCGLMMDINGNVYEIVEGAKNDCVKKILRINKNANIKFHSLNKRIKKLTDRGWKSEINLTKVKHKQARLEKVMKRKAEKLEKQQNEFLFLSNGNMHEYLLRDGKAELIVDTSKMRIFELCENSLIKTSDMFYAMFRKYGLDREMRSCEIKVFRNRIHHVVISICNKTNIISSFKTALSHLEHKFLSIEKFKSKKLPENLLFFENALKVTDQPHQHNHSFRAYKTDHNSKTYKIDLDMRNLATHPYPPDTPAKVENSTSVEIPEDSVEVPEDSVGILEESVEVPKDYFWKNSDENSPGVDLSEDVIRKKVENLEKAKMETPKVKLSKVSLKGMARGITIPEKRKETIDNTLKTPEKKEITPKNNLILTY